MEVGEIKRVRQEKLGVLRDQDMSGYGGKFVCTNSINEVLEDFVEEKEVVLAGRLMSVRSHGKVSFGDLQDQTGKMQLFLKIGNVKEEIIKALDIGDIIGVKGTLFHTKTEQKSVRVHELVVLSKSLMTLPEKWHGLKDVEIRYRQRYVDLIVNEDVRSLFIKRSKIVTYIRNYLDNKGFLEVETPMLQQFS